MKTGSRLGTAIRKGHRPERSVLSCLLLFGLLWSAKPGASAASLPAGFTEEAVPGPWNEVVGLAFEADEQIPGGRTYVWERGGQVWIIENGIRQSTPLLDLREEVGGWRD